MKIWNEVYAVVRVSGTGKDKNGKEFRFKGYRAIVLETRVNDDGEIISEKLHTYKVTANFGETLRGQIALELWQDDAKPRVRGVAYFDGYGVLRGFDNAQA